MSAHLPLLQISKNMRKLATIQTISAIEPITNADSIELVRILGWAVVVKRGEYRVGDKIIYCEIDSLLPERPEFEFLRSNCFKPAQIDATGRIAVPAGFRIRTIKLRGQYSQGICFPVSLLPNGDHIPIGTEVTAELGIVKWEPPIPAGMVGKIKGPFPSFVPKTDETRVQLLADALERHKGKELIVTEKLDGSSFTAFHYQSQFGICSRNQWIDEMDGTSKYVAIAESFHLREKLAEMSKQLGFDLAVQGEMIGPGIQGNKYRLEFVTLRFFNVVNLTTGMLLDFDQMQEVIKSLGLVAVPFLEKVTLNHSIDELIKLAEGKSVLNSSTLREGIVLRPISETFEPDTGGRLSFKAINPAFLVKYDE